MLKIVGGPHTDKIQVLDESGKDILRELAVACMRITMEPMDLVKLEMDCHEAVIDLDVLPEHIVVNMIKDTPTKDHCPVVFASRTSLWKNKK